MTTEIDLMELRIYKFLRRAGIDHDVAAQAGEIAVTKRSRTIEEWRLYSCRRLVEFGFGVGDALAVHRALHAVEHSRAEEQAVNIGHSVDVRLNESIQATK